MRPIVIGRREKTTSICGTLPYMAPEQVAADGIRADIRTDVYAIGLIGYELLTGERPHTDTSGGAYELIHLMFTEILSRS